MQSAAGEASDSRRSWGIAGVGAIAMIFTFGTPLSYGVFRGPFSEAFAVSPVALSAVFSLMLFTFFNGSGLVGVFAARLPARAVRLAVAGATALLGPSLYVVESYVGLVVVVAVLGLALGTVFVLVTSVVLQGRCGGRGIGGAVVFPGARLDGADLERAIVGEGTQLAN